MITKHQRKLLEQLRSNKENAYADASLYTILLDLCDGSGVDDVFLMLHNVAHDLDKREQLESLCEECPGWEWSDETE